MQINRREIHIQWGDCDPGGIVYFPRYFEYCDECTNALFERAGFPKQQVLKQFGIAGIPMVESRARFLVPSQFDDIVIFESQVTEWGRSSFSVQHRLYKGDVLAAEVIEKRVWVEQISDDVIRYKGRAIPQEVKDKLSSPASVAGD
jgi:4-hydroxybenzoyl-CoA thioesterase